MPVITEVVEDKVSSIRSVNIDKPYWDQSSYRGRALHFLTVTNPLNIFAPKKELERAREVVKMYR